MIHLSREMEEGEQGGGFKVEWEEWEEYFQLLCKKRVERGKMAGGWGKRKEIEYMNS